MPLPYTDERLLIVALELIRKQVADLPMAIAMNMGRTAPPAGAPAAPAAPAAPGAVTAFDRPQAVVVVGPRPLPVAGAPGGPPAPARNAGGEDEAGLFSRMMRNFLGQFASMLGPVAVFAAIVGSELSGARVLAGALNLFASSVAPVLIPLTFALATGLAAASDTVWRKFAPALEGFYKTMIDTAIPAVEHFADVAGKAASALVTLSKVPGVGPGREGGFWGALNRTLDRAGGPGPDAGKKASTQIENGLDDFARVMTVGLAEPAIRLKDRLKEKLGVEPNRQGGASDEAKRATAQAELDTKRELLFQLGSSGGVGSIKGNFAAAQAASTSMSPFQQKVLERLQETVAALERATQRPPNDPYRATE